MEPLSGEIKERCFFIEVFAVAIVGNSKENLGQVESIPLHDVHQGNRSLGVL